MSARKKNSNYYTELNRKAWNHAMPRHRKVMDEKWDAMLLKKDFIFQSREELKELREIGFINKDIAHLCCNNGIELLSLKKNGAGKCTGFDISDEAILDAEKRASKFGLDCRFIRTDVLDMEKSYHDKFDLVYITVGALAWIPDLGRLFRNASNILKAGGMIFIHEHHPFGDLFPYDGETEDPLRVKYPYFNDEVLESSEGIDYYGNTVYDSPVSYEFSYTISDLLNSLIENSFRIMKFNEYERDIALGHQELEKLDRKIPLSYILIGQKIPQP